MKPDYKINPMFLSSLDKNKIFIMIQGIILNKSPLRELCLKKIEASIRRVPLSFLCANSILFVSLWSNRLVSPPSDNYTTVLLLFTMLFLITLLGFSLTQKSFIRDCLTFGFPFGLMLGLEGKLPALEEENERILRHWSSVVYMMTAYNDSMYDFLSIPLISLCVLLQNQSNNNQTYLILVIAFSIIEAFAKKKKNGSNRDEISLLRERVKELQEFKRIVFEELDIDLLTIKQENEETKNEKKSFLSVMGKLHNSLSKLFKVKNHITLRSPLGKSKHAKIDVKQEKGGYMVEEISKTAKLLFDDEKEGQNRNLGEIFDILSICRDEIPTTALRPSSTLNNMALSKPKRISEIFKNKFTLSKDNLNEGSALRLFKLESKVLLYFPPPKPSRIIDPDLRSELEKLRQVGKAKDRLLFSISHDMRTPLNGIIYYINSATEAPNENLRMQKLENAKINTEILLSLVNDLLDFSRHEHGNLVVNLSEFKLQKLLDRVEQMVTVEALNKGIMLHIMNQCPESLSLYSDECRLQQILINLVSNAIKFTFKGVIRLRATQIEFMGKDVVKFEVCDTGLGINPGILPLLAQPFATFDSPNKKVNKNGIGLGLFICKSLVGKLGPMNELYINSKEGKGSHFGFLISVKQKEEVSPSVKNLEISEIQHMTEDEKKSAFTKIFMSDSEFHCEEENLLESDLRDFLIKSKNISNNSFYNNYMASTSSLENIKKTRELTKLSAFTQSSMKESTRHNILIVDDQGYILKIMLEMVNSFCEKTVNAESATNGLMALEIFCALNAPNAQNEKIDIVFMDSEMPIMGGIEAAEMMRKKMREESFKEAKIVICSGDVRKEGTDGVIDDWIMKPVSKKTLYSCLNRFLKD